MSHTIDEIRCAIENTFVAPLPRRDASGSKSTKPRPISTPHQIYARKLRRLILAALERPDPGSNPWFGALRELGGQAGYAFCNPDSPTTAGLTAMRATLSEPQYTAVVSFLEWVSDEAHELDDRHLATAALRCLWTRYGRNRARVAAFLEPLTNYQRPPIAELESEKLARQIEAAFASTPYPAEIAPSVDYESCDVALLFDGMRWPWLTPEYLDIEPAALSFFSPEAFRYFLPAYLLCVAGTGLINANPVFHLVHGLTPESRDRRVRTLGRFVSFSHEEREAIVAFLQACIVDLTDYKRNSDITAALDSYWVPSLAGGSVRARG